MSRVSPPSGPQGEFRLFRDRERAEDRGDGRETGGSGRHRCADDLARARRGWRDDKWSNDSHRAGDVVEEGACMGSRTDDAHVLKCVSRGVVGSRHPSWTDASARELANRGVWDHLLTSTSLECTTITNSSIHTSCA